MNGFFLQRCQLKFLYKLLQYKRNILKMFEQVNNIPYEAEWRDAVTLEKRDWHKYPELSQPSGLVKLHGGMNEMTPEPTR